jgi:glycosyltransferase involved in cell wall biosynthesis
LLEYLAAGLPYVVTATGEIAHAVRGTDTGWTVSVRDPAAFARALDAIGDLAPQERTAMGACGRELALREFDQRATAARVAGIYDRLVEWPSGKLGARFGREQGAPVGRLGGISLERERRP